MVANMGIGLVRAAFGASTTPAVSFSNLRFTAAATLGGVLHPG
jgi:hypothetical protein